MALVSHWLQYLRDHPTHGLAAAAILLAAFFFINRKSRLSREADKRLEELRKDRGEYYRQLRPPRR